MSVKSSEAILVGDVHLSDKAPSGRVTGYLDQILNKVRFASDTAKELNVPLVFGGDVFHLKASSKNSHALVQSMHDALQGVRTFIVVGNHDLSGDRLDTIDRQPIGALARMKGVSLLMGTDEELPGISGIPYLTEFDGGNWKHAAEKWNEVIGEPELLVTHAPIFPPGQAPGVYFSIDPDEWAEYFLGVPACFYSHIHDNHSVYTDTKGYMTFCNHGALSRGSLHESSINRSPAITFWRNSVFERIDVPYLSADEVFLFEEAQYKAVNKVSAQEFNQAVGTTSLESLTLTDLRATLQSQTSDQQVLAIIDDILESLQ